MRFEFPGIGRDDDVAEQLWHQKKWICGRAFQIKGITETEVVILQKQASNLRIFTNLQYDAL